MPIERDLKRFNEVGEERRSDLSEFITYGDLGRSREDKIKIPIKIIDLPEFEYDQRDMGGVVQGEDGEPQEGQQVGQPEEGQGDDGEEGDEEGEAGDEGGEHGYYEMDPEEFAQELDEELDLDLEPKGKKVIEEKEGRFTEMQQSGPRSLLDVDDMFKRGLKRTLATLFDENYLEELLKVNGVGPGKAFEYARENNINVSKGWFENTYVNIDDDEIGKYDSIEEFEEEVTHRRPQQLVRDEGIEHVEFRRDDQKFRRAETIKERQKNVVVINIRDVSGSMREMKRELVERVFTPLDWYLQGKYDKADFQYIAHDAEAWEVDRVDFFGIRSGGGTRISEAYELAAKILEDYPFSEWNRYIYAAGDGENKRNDTEENVIPYMEEIKANQHAYVEVQPDGGGRNAQHANLVEEHFENTKHPTGNVTVARVGTEEEVPDAIKKILEDA